MADQYYKSPMTIYVVWHPRAAKGKLYADALYQTFCRDVDSPLARALGIPVYFRFQPVPGSDMPIDIDTGESDKNAIVLLVDAEMFGDVSWSRYVQQLLAKDDNINTRIYPVALSPYAFSLDEDRLGKKQFINLTASKFEGEQGIELSFKELRSRLLHDFSRFLFTMERIVDADNQLSSPPVKLFISHAKADGETIAIRFRNFITANLKLKTFFDTNDIADADDFEEALSANLQSSAIVVFLTDRYSTREWCQIEVIVAKRNKSPLVVVNNLTKGEKRSFPYLGNVPTICLSEDNFDEIVDVALYQVLNNLYLGEKLLRETDLYDLDTKYHLLLLKSPPELFNYLDIKKVQAGRKDDRGILVVYPDPPLGTEELRLLNDLDSEIEFISPSSFYRIM